MNLRLGVKFLKYVPYYSQLRCAGCDNILAMSKLVLTNEDIFHLSTYKNLSFIQVSIDGVPKTNNNIS